MNRLAIGQDTDLGAGSMAKLAKLAELAELAELARLASAAAVGVHPVLDRPHAQVEDLGCSRR